MEWPVSVQDRYLYFTIDTSQKAKAHTVQYPFRYRFSCSLRFEARNTPETAQIDLIWFSNVSNNVIHNHRFKAEERAQLTVLVSSTTSGTTSSGSVGGSQNDEEDPTPTNNGLTAECETRGKEGDGDDISSKTFWRIVIGSGILLVLVMLPVVVVPLILLPGEESSEDPVDLFALSEEEEEGYDLTLVPNLSNSTILTLLEDPHSVQARAYDWISADPHWDSYQEDWRQQQRFAMVCLYYAFQNLRNLGDGYFFLDHMDPALHKCEWDNRLS